MSDQEQLFLRRVAVRLADTGQEPTPENIAAAMRAVLDRDAELVALVCYEQSERARETRRGLARHVYDAIRRSTATRERGTA